MKFIRVLCIITKDMQHISRSCPGLCMKKIGQSFCWRRWAEGAGACPSGDNAGLPILGLRHSLRPEWKHGITGLR